MTSIIHFIFNYSNTKFLGIIIDDGLKFSNHISYIKNKIAKGFGIILYAQKFYYKKNILKFIPFIYFPISNLLR